MKKEVTIVPKDKCPLDVLAELGERTENAWIFLDVMCCNKLVESEGCEVYTRKDDETQMQLKWKATKEYPATTVLFEVPIGFGWGKIISIEAEDIAFTFEMADPEEIFFLKMEE